MNNNTTTNIEVEYKNTKDAGSCHACNTSRKVYIITTNKIQVRYCDKCLKTIYKKSQALRQS